MLLVWTNVAVALFVFTSLTVPSCARPTPTTPPPAPTPQAPSPTMPPPPTITPPPPPPPADCFAEYYVRPHPFCSAVFSDEITEAEGLSILRKTIHLTNPNGCWQAYIQSNGDRTNWVPKEPGCPENELGGQNTRVCRGPCPTNRHRQLTEGATPVEPGDEDYVKYSSMCRNVDYNGWLVIEEGHFFVLGSPTKKEDGFCPHVGTHAVFEGPKVEATDDPYIKEALIWKNTKQDEMQHFLKDALPLGVFKASDIISAYESIDPSKSTNKVYDIVNFNCVNFLIALASAMDVKIDAKMTSFVTRRLLGNSAAEIAGMVRESTNFFSLFAGRQLRADNSESATDEQIIQALVDQTTAGLTVKEADAPW